MNQTTLLGNGVYNEYGAWNIYGTLFRRFVKGLLLALYFVLCFNSGASYISPQEYHAVIVMRV